MSQGLNRVMLIGNLGQDPDLRFGQGGAGTAYLNLRIATTESYYNKRTNSRDERTEWHTVVLFGNRAEALAKILEKGKTLFIEGRLQTDTYEKDGQKRYATKIVATEVILLGRAPSGASRGSDASRGEGTSRRGAGASRGGNEHGEAPYMFDEDDFDPREGHGMSAPNRVPRGPSPDKSAPASAGRASGGSASGDDPGDVPYYNDEDIPF